MTDASAQSFTKIQTASHLTRRLRCDTWVLYDVFLYSRMEFGRSVIADFDRAFGREAAYPAARSVVAGSRLTGSSFTFSSPNSSFRPIFSVPCISARHAGRCCWSCESDCQCKISSHLCRRIFGHTFHNCTPRFSCLGSARYSTTIRNNRGGRRSASSRTSS